MMEFAESLSNHNHQGIEIESWLKSLPLKQAPKTILKQACKLNELTQDQKTFFNQSCAYFALDIARLVIELQLDQEATAAAIAYTNVEYGGLKCQDIEEQLGNKISKLIKGIQKMDALTHLQTNNSFQQLDNLRRMLLAIVSDVRVVVIKLAERLCIMRAIKHSHENLRLQLAQETNSVYAPLANRLGIHQLKWELEDLAFYYLEPETYKHIAKQLQQRRTEREQNIKMVIDTLQQQLKQSKIKATVYGRAKHIYSIYRKMQRKKVNFSEIYDAQAVRILVPSIEDCYTALSLAHELWSPIKEEFDDYIQTPKANGYQSIHTAVIGPYDKSFEIQIRTHQMHENAEKGVAAHWVYKEGSKQKQDSHEQQIAWLRQLLHWQQEVSEQDNIPEDIEKQIFEDRIYVFTPQGKIVDLPHGATPLDFAYNIHTEIGHRCRGAKINGKIVPLTYTLNTGEKVEILTTNKIQPSRDWLIIKRGYLKTSRARAKILTWFKQQESSHHLETGRAMLERELNRLNITANIEKVAQQLKFKTSNAMLTALGNSDIKISRIVNLITKDIPKKPIDKNRNIIKISSAKKSNTDSDVTIYGVGGLVTRIAQCCKPVPGDPILGYVTIGHGVSIHHHDCKNIIQDAQDHHDRIIAVEWHFKNQQKYSVNIVVEAYDRPGLVSDISNTLSNEKINITHLTTAINQNQLTAKINLTVEIADIDELSKLLDRINQLPNIYHAARA